MAGGEWRVGVENGGWGVGVGSGSREWEWEWEWGGGGVNPTIKRHTAVECVQ